MTLLSVSGLSPHRTLGLEPVSGFLAIGIYYPSSLWLPVFDMQLSFMKNVYTSFDVGSESVGFAALAQMA